MAGFPRTDPVSAQEVEPSVEAEDDFVWTEVGVEVAIDVTDNDSDDSDDNDLVVTVADPDDGTASVVVDDGEPSVLFVPDGSFEGVTSFSYEACVDGGCDSADVTVYVGLSACTIVGTDGPDTLNGTASDDVICALRGADVVNAGAGDDLVFGGRGHDELNGGDGNDVIHGNRGNDVITGGRGADQLHGGRDRDTLSGNRGNDRLAGGRGQDTLNGGNGQDVLIGKNGNDILNGGDGADVLRGWRGDDVLNGQNGDDKLYGGRNADVLNGGEGDDLLKGKRGQDTLNGDAGDDDLRGNRGDDALDGGEGIDTLDGGNGTDTCIGETVSNCEDTPVEPVEPVFCSDLEATIVGTEGPDVLVGTDGPDVIAGLGGDDQIDGLGGDDVLCGDGGIDTVSGGLGDDLISGGDGVDALLGDEGDDFVSGNDGDDVLDGGDGDDYVFGDAGDDLIDAGAGADVLEGADGDDQLIGGSGDDEINGGAGTDSAFGGEGTDSCSDVESEDACESLSDPSDVTTALEFIADEPFDVEVPPATLTKTAGVDSGAKLSLETSGGILADDVLFRVDASPISDTIAAVSVGPVFVVEVQANQQNVISGSLALPYSEDRLGGASESTLAIAKYSRAQGRWITLDSVVDESTNVVTTSVGGADQQQLVAGVGQGRALVDLQDRIGSLYTVRKVDGSFALDSYREQLERVADAQAGVGCGGLGPDGAIPYYFDVPSGPPGQYQNVWSAIPGDPGTVWYLEGSGPDFDFVRQTSFGALRKLDTATGLTQVVKADIYVASPQDSRRDRSADHDFEHRAFISATANGGVLLVETGLVGGYQISRFDSDGVEVESRSLSVSGELVGAVQDVGTDQLYVLTSAFNDDGTLVFGLFAHSTGSGFVDIWQTVVPDIVGATRPALHLTDIGLAVSYQTEDFINPLGPRNYASFDSSGNYVDTSLVEPDFLPAGNSVEIDRGSNPAISYLDESGALISSTEVTANLFGSDHEFLEVSDVVDGVFLFYGTTTSGLPRSDGGTTPAGSFVMAIDAEQMGGQLEVPLVVADDGDGDGIPDCEEVVGLPSMSWIHRADTPNEFPFIVTLSTSIVPDANGNPRGWDTDEDGLSDGEELQSYDVESFEFITDEDRAVLLETGVTKIYVASSLPYERDSDRDLNTDFEEVLDGTDPMRPDYAKLAGAIYQSGTILQPDDLGQEPFLSSFFQLETTVVDSLTIQLDREVVTPRAVLNYNDDFDCVSANCGNWYAQFDFDDPPTEDQTEMARDRFRQVVEEQNIFVADTGFFGPDIELTDAVIAGFLHINCAAIGAEGCVDGDRAQSLSSDSLGISATTAALPAKLREAEIQRNIGNKNAQELESHRTDGPGTRWKITTGALTVIVALLVQAEKPDPFRATRLIECEEVMSLESTEAIVETLGLGNYGIDDGLALPHCATLPVYYPGSELGQATLFRYNAIHVQGQPAILSQQTRESHREGTSRFPDDWYRAVPWRCGSRNPDFPSGMVCDEYPNQASGEAGPKAGLNNGSAYQDTRNQRSASLCPMSAADNGKEGKEYGKFKLSSDVQNITGALFLVVPDPTLPTDSHGKVNLDFVRVGVGSYSGPEAPIEVQGVDRWNPICRQ